jgi:hypothetical protein
MTDSEGRLHGLLHSSQYLVQNGASVTEGQRLAIMGATGAADGVHLHWCVKQNNKFIDPMGLIGEDMWNEGDRKNINFWLFDEDRLLWPGLEGFTYKNAIGAIFTSKEWAQAKAEMNSSEYEELLFKVFKKKG